MYDGHVENLRCKSSVGLPLSVNQIVILKSDYRELVEQGIAKSWIYEQKEHGKLYTVLKFFCLVF